MALVVFLVALLYLSAFASFVVRIGDEGTLVNGAAAVANGAVAYRDFADLANPLSYYWLAAWFATFGTSLAVARMQLLVTGAAAAAVLFWLAARAYDTPTGLAVAVVSTVLGIPYWPGTSHHWDSHLFFLLTLVCLALWQRRGAPWLALLTGAMAAVTANFLITKGIVALAAALTIVLLDWRRTRRLQPLLGVLLGFFIVNISIWIFFAALGAFPDFFYVNFLFPFTQYPDTGRLAYAFYFRDLAWHTPLSVLSLIAPPLVARALTTVLAVPPATVAALPGCVLLLLVLRRYAGLPPLSKEMTLLWIGGAALWLGETHRWDLYHLMYGAPVLMAVAVGETLGLAGQRRWGKRVVGGLVVCSMALGAWHAAVALAAQTRLETRRGIIRTHGHDEALEFLLTHTSPRDYVFVYPYYPMYYFLANLRNPARNGILLYHYNTDAQFQEAVTALEQTKPRYVLWDTLVDGAGWKQWYPNYVPPPPGDLIVEPYLTAHYRTIVVKNGFRIMQRTDVAD